MASHTRSSSDPLRRIRLVATGDLMLGDSAICTGYGFASTYSGVDFAEAAATVAALFGPADLVFGNLECSLSPHGHEPREWASTQLRGRPEYAAGLRAAGYNIVSVANNHASQHGDQAFAETVALMRDAGVECCGVRGTGPWCSEPVVIELAGSRAGFLGYCLRPRQYSPAIPPYAEGSASDIADDIDRLKETVDHVVVSLHWGEEYVPAPSVGEVEMAQDLIAAGATLILGHHPHVPRPVQQYRDGVIAYSLGNFISDMIWYPPLRESLLLTMDLTDRPERVAVVGLHIADSYLPVPYEPARSVPVVMDVHGLHDDAYQREVARTVRHGRITAYRHAAANVRRFRSPTLRRLLGTTVRNKLTGLARAVRRRKDMV
jgi:gamma-polyglutamate biosynthesis protein CapA